jgi:hypothetical protein
MCVVAGWDRHAIAPVLFRHVASLRDYTVSRSGRNGTGHKLSTQIPYCHSERSEESGGGRTLLQYRDKDDKALVMLQFSIIPTHLIPHCVRNDKKGFCLAHYRTGTLRYHGGVKDLVARRLD